MTFDSSESTRRTQVHRYREGSCGTDTDLLAVEEPLEIRLGYRLVGKPARRSVSITMRTPGADAELAAGFLYGESILSGPDDIAEITGPDADDVDNPTNIIRIDVADGVDVDLASLQRNFYTTSSCGVCGKASLEALEIDDCTALHDIDFKLPAEMIPRLPHRLRDAQPLFETTGGIHAAGLFDADANLVALREDVGRHNAMDKLVGARLLADELPANQHAVVLSGRASFELLQKALRASIPFVVAVGAPSSLAVDLADEFGITLVGFARNGRFNVYTHPDRVSV